MSLEEDCKKGEIKIWDFTELLGTIPRRTHLLEKGDFAVRTCVGREDIVAVEEIVELNSPEEGDFTTDKGTTGPISGNVFIKIQKGDSPKYFIIEGDKVGEVNYQDPIYDLVRNFIEQLR